jgi:PIN domain nuclease of toxin-antitoxin system
LNAILDASALLAWMLDEPGAESVESVLADSAISSLNWSEIMQKSLAHGANFRGLREELEALGLTILAFDKEDAERTAQLWGIANNLSLADRACLALGIQYGTPVYTADRLWVTVATGADVRLIRP